MAERYQRSTLYQPPGADFSAADTATQLSQALSSFSRRSLANYQDARLAQGSQRGAEEGEGLVDASKTKKKTEATAYGRSYNQTLIQGHTAAVEANIQQNMSRLADQYKDDPDGYKQALAGYRKGMFESVMPELQTGVGREIDSQGANTLRQINERFQERKVKEAHGQIAEGLEAYKLKGAQQARDGDIAGMTETGERARALIESNTMSAENPTGFFDPTRTPQLLAGLKDDLDENLLVGQIDRAGSVDAVKGIAKKLQSGKLVEQDLSPEVRDRAVAHAERRIAQMESDARASQAEARAALQEREQDDLAQYRNGIDVKAPLRLSDYVQAYGDKGSALFADYEANRQIGKDISMLGGMPKSGILARVASREPIPGAGYADSEKRQDSLAKASAHVLAMRESDPAAAVKVEPVGTPEEITRKRLTEQTRLEVENIKPLTNAEADSIVAQFALGTEDSAALMAGLAEQYGEYWPEVYAQLAENKLPAAAVAIGSGMAPGPATRLAALANVPLADIRKGVDTQLKEVQDELDSQFAEFGASLDGVLGGQKTFAAMYESAERLAWSYVKTGQSPKAATERAYLDVIGAQYDFETVNQRVVRIPRKYAVEGVRQGLARAINKVDVAGLQPPDALASSSPEQLSKEYSRAIKRGGYWVTSDNRERGVVLFLDGAPVMRRDGSVYEVTWDSLIEDVRARTEERERLIEDELFRQMEQGDPR